jgi:MerR family mercuric resistance operon transcriptional regulator
MRAAGTSAERLTIGRLAQLGGVNLETVRYYEREELLPKPPRTASGYRIFPRDAARRLRFIKRAQELGFTLQEIRELLALRLKPGASRADMRGQVEEKIADIDRKLRTLEAMKKTLRQLAERCEGCGPLSECPILESLDEGSGE